jgi:hypothetical protein
VALKRLARCGRIILSIQILVPPFAPDRYEVGSRVIVLMLARTPAQGSK